jgi:acetyl esterase/lipase
MMAHGLLRSPAMDARWFAVLAVYPAVLGLGCSDVEVESDVSYDDRFGIAKLDVYSPPRRATPRPAVLVIHAVQDCVCALAFVRAHADEYGIDPARVAAYGYSAGGHLASMLGTAAGDPVVAPDCAAGKTGPVAAVVSGAGPQDMRLLPEVEVVTDFVGGTQAEVPQAYLDASPIIYVAPGAPPFLFISGDNDWFVDIEHSRRMQRALAEVGTESKLLAIPGGGHLFNRGASGASWDLELSIDTPESWAVTIDFLDRTIGGDL